MSRGRGCDLRKSAAVYEVSREDKLDNRQRGEQQWQASRSQEQMQRTTATRGPERAKMERPGKPTDYRWTWRYRRY